MDKKIFAMTVRFSDPEKAWIEVEADRLGVGLGEVVRRAIQRCQRAEADANRLAGLEARLAAMIRSIPEQTAHLLVPEVSHE